MCLYKAGFVSSIGVTSSKRCMFPVNHLSLPTVGGECWRFNYQNPPMKGDSFREWIGREEGKHIDRPTTKGQDHWLISSCGLVNPESIQFVCEGLWSRQTKNGHGNAVVVTQWSATSPFGHLFSLFRKVSSSSPSWVFITKSHKSWRWDPREHHSSHLHSQKRRWQ